MQIFRTIRRQDERFSADLIERSSHFGAGMMNLGIRSAGFLAGSGSYRVEAETPIRFYYVTA